MTLRLLKPTLGYMRSTLPMAQPAREEPRVERLRGGSLQSMRTRVFARSGHLCECAECRAYLPKPLTWSTFELDHVVRVADGGDNSMDNLRAVHVTCHARITARQNAEVSLYGCVLSQPTVKGRPLLDAMHQDQDDPDDMPC